MKKTLLLVLIFTFSKSLLSQDYTPLLDNYNEWHLTYCKFNDCSTDFYYTNGDTIVDGMNYKVLDNYHYISRGFLLRENVAEKKVFLKAIIPNGVFDYLLYDFSLEVGDSIDIKNPITPFPENAGYFILDSIIPRPLVDGNNYRHFYLSPTMSNTVATNNAIWVEGVGSLSIINAPGGDPDINSVGRVGCMFKNGIAFYSDLSIIDECEPFFILDTPQFTYEKNTIIAIKTPTSNVFELTPVGAYRTIELYDFKGIKLDSFKNNEASIQLNLSQYQSGIYLLIFKSNTERSQVLKISIE